MKLMIHGYRLECTCRVCPEQYDVFDCEGTQVAYLRLRHGYFSATFPDVMGKCVYEAQPNGDGMFTEKERMKYLRAAIKAVQEEISNRGFDYVD